MVPFLQRLLLAAVVIATVVLVAFPALAEGEAITGVHEVRDGDERTPVAGVVTEVYLGEALVGSATSDDDGSWSVPLPGPGTVRVVLDVGSLPDGVAPTDPERTELDNVAVRTGQEKVVRFQLGPGRDTSTSLYTRVGELFLVGLKFGAIIALCSIGLSMIYGVTELVNFAHGELITLGAVITWWFNVLAGWHLALAAIPGVLAVAAFGGAQERWMWLPLRRRKSGTISLIVVSIGLSLLLRYGVILVPFGGQPQSFRQYAIQEPWTILGIDVVPKTLFVIVATAVILLLVGLGLQRTRFGTAMRAVSDNPDLARSSGIDVDRVILVTWVVGAGLAALGGVFFGLSETVEWQMGFRLLLMVFAAVVLGGLGSPFGAMLGGFLVGVIVEMSTLFLSVEFKNVIALGALIIMLLFRPQGLLGQRERVG
jgi:neutral amino acid transport system permease protein